MLPEQTRENERLRLKRVKEMFERSTLISKTDYTKLVKETYLFSTINTNCCTKYEEFTICVLNRIRTVKIGNFKQANQDILKQDYHICHSSASWNKCNGKYRFSACLHRGHIMITLYYHDKIYSVYTEFGKIKETADKLYSCAKKGNMYGFPFSNYNDPVFEKTALNPKYRAEMKKNKIIVEEEDAEIDEDEDDYNVIIIDEHPSELYE